MAPRETEIIERFQLLFLGELGAALDKQLYAVKGGCNLRFFWKSIRYSQDIDLDVRTVAKHTLQMKVDQILDRVGFRRILATSGIQVARFSRPKQTEITQRWKIHLLQEVPVIEVLTRIEFSRRKFDRGILFEAVDSEITTSYKLKPILASHYNIETAFAQKIRALALRSQTQARDVFDLAFLLDRGARGEGETKKMAAAAAENAQSVSFDQFKSQVVAFLAPAYQGYYGSKKNWEMLQQKVIMSLERI
jgi:predicted nucleotidyltransferase component of viral defense system